MLVSLGKHRLRGGRDSIVIFFIIGVARINISLEPDVTTFTNRLAKAHYVLHHFSFRKESTTTPGYIA